MTYKMETTKLPNYGILEAAIPKDIIDDLWKLIEESKQNPVDKRHQLAGVITSSLDLNTETPIIQKVTDAFDDFAPLYECISHLGISYKVKITLSVPYFYISKSVPFLR